MPYHQVSPPNSSHLCQRLSYMHETDIYQQNPQSKRICQKFKRQQFSIRKVRSQSSNQSCQNYDKYYIKPSLRYKKKNLDPKKSILAQGNEQYFYDNLHNEQFWQWKHPFQKDAIITQQRISIQDRINPKILQKFKQDLQDGGYARLPLVVRSVLSNKI